MIWPIGYVVTCNLEAGTVLIEPIQGPVQSPEGIDNHTARSTLRSAALLLADQADDSLTIESSPR